MANQDDSTSGLPGATGGVPLQPVGARRRRFAGLGASGVILTLVSQPAMADLVCKSFSGGASKPPGGGSTGSSCEGRSPGFYCKPENWGGTYTDPNAKFKDVFTVFGLGSPLTPYTLLQVINMDYCVPVVDSSSASESGRHGHGHGHEHSTPECVSPPENPDKSNVARHIVATLLNVRSKRINFFTEEMVTTMWTEYASTGSYVPFAGEPAWSATKLVDELTRRMI